jgi:tetratricopeptide (TPR) repeat protein
MKTRIVSLNERSVRPGFTSVVKGKLEKLMGSRDLERRSQTPKPALHKANRLLETAKEKYEGLDYKGALAAADEAFKLDCNEAQLYRGLSLLKLKDEERACNDLNAVYSRTPYADIRLYLGLSECRSLSIEERISKLTKGIEVFSTSADLYLRRAQVYIDMLLPDKALSDYQCAVEISGSSGLSYIVRGDVHRMKGDLQAAYTSYTRAVQFPKTSVQALVRRVQLNLQMLELSAASHDIHMVRLT